MEDKINKLKDIINNSKKIVFLEEQEYLLKVEYLTLEVKMAYII